ncbi:MAG TPA: hypothetical protein PKL54_10010 [Candidatus Hydrogenedentes bacterium]|nr:hypothetical protein [Candidatus Hydrogenedentota bacterium]HOC73139.1 hypothetical protein [Candidatus Hydrogenedentota bacterium]
MKGFPRLLTLGLAACAALAAAQDQGLGGYSSMEIDAGQMKGNFATGAIDEMTGGVKIRLLSDDEKLKPLPIKAQTMKFTWTEGASTPSLIIMEKGVEVTHPDASITADRAEWNFDSGALVFTGNPVVNNERIKGLRGDRMTLNLKDNTFQVDRVRADQVPLQGVEGGGARGGAMLVSESDVKDWAGLITALRGELKAGGPSPARQITGLLSPDKQKMLTTLDTAVLLENKGELVKVLNNAVKSPKLYDEAAWAGKALPEEAKALVAAAERSPEDQAKLNRLLLHAAYPELVAAP